MTNKLNTYSILVTDDDLTTREYIKFHLEKAGYLVMAAEDGFKAIEMLETHKIDLIISDIMMPEMDGFDFQRRLSENPCTKDIPFIFLTARSDDEDQVKGLQTGVREYITKPFNPRLLAVKVENIIRISGHEQHLRDKYNELKVDLETASKTQEIFLPESNQVFQSIRFNYLYQPYFLVSGDVFDFIKVSDERIVLYIGDISGHGAKTALLMTAAKTYIDSLIRRMSHIRPHEIMRDLNREMLKYLGQHHMSCIFCVIDLTLNTIRMYNAGHPSPIYIEKSGVIKRIADAGGIPIGWMPDFSYLPEDEIEVELQDEEIILFFTDGLFDCENLNAKKMGYHNLIPVLDSGLEHERFDQVCKAVKDRIHKAGYITLTDDCTLISIKKSSATPPPSPGG